MSEERVDSREAARSALRLLLIAMFTGLAAGAATWAFLYVDHAGVAFFTERLPEMLPTLSPQLVSAGVVIAMTAVCALIVQLSAGRPFDTGAAEAEFDREGRMDYRRLPAGIAFSLASLFSGAAVGPEAPLTDISGGIGTLIAERLGLESRHLRIITYTGVAGAFGAFFGAAPVGALLAAELISPKAMNISRLELAAGLASGATAYVAYLLLGGHVVNRMLMFPTFGSARMTDMALGVAVGIVGAVIGLVYAGGFMKVRLAMQKVRVRPWLAALLGGAPLVAAALFAPYLMFSGQSETPKLLAQAATLGVVVLLALGIGKLVLSVWSLSTAYFGGPIFPVIFAGTCFGLVLNLLVPSIPQGVAVTAMIAGMTVAATAAPFSVTLFIALISEPALAPVIALAAVAAFIVRQAVAPTVPGVYRATRAAEDKASQDTTAAGA